ALMTGSSVNVLSGGSIYTSGALSHGILAQSVSGGGGVAGLTASASMTALLAGSVVTLGASQSGNNSLIAGHQCRRHRAAQRAAQRDR
ncbi:hypothetical protein ACOICY_28975, partial [Klebsiella pneumoniae]|uniref:hypothetical protein n=1 Tax=Klebsiella pneumoniae TaxID=573 RepID=UPI003B59EE98